MYKYLVTLILLIPISLQSAEKASYGKASMPVIAELQKKVTEAEQEFKANEKKYRMAKDEMKSLFSISSAAGYDKKAVNDAKEQLNSLYDLYPEFRVFGVSKKDKRYGQFYADYADSYARKVRLENQLLKLELDQCLHRLQELGAVKSGKSGSSSSSGPAGGPALDND